MPVKIPKPIILVSAFAMGLIIDMFYDSPGVHASALVFGAFIRDYLLNIIEPEKGFGKDYFFDIKRLGVVWVVSYLGMFMLFHLLFYYSVEAFSMIYFYEIMISTIISLILSVLVMSIYLLIDHPKIR